MSAPSLHSNAGIDASSPYGGLPPEVPNRPRREGPAPNAIMSGNIEEQPLQELMEIFATSRRNGVFVLYELSGSIEREGRLHMRNGRIVYAAIDNHIPNDISRTAIRILSWAQADFELQPPNDQEIVQEIDEDPVRLLLSAKRQEKDIQRYRQALPAGAYYARVNHPLQAPLRDLRPEHLDVFQLVLNQGTVDGVLNYAKNKDLEIYQNLVFLYKNQYIQVS